MSISDATTFSPGQRLLIRDAEWWVKRVDVTDAGYAALSVTGVSEIVRGAPVGKMCVICKAARFQKHLWMTRFPAGRLSER
jgi:hypothetical protein